METKKSIKDKANEKIAGFKSELENLNLQFHLGKEEAEDEFEKQKSALKDWTNKTDAKIISLEGEVGDQFNKLKSHVEGLNLQAALGKADAEDALNEQQKNLSHKIREVKLEAENLYHSSEGKVKLFAGEVDEQIDKYHAKFDLFRIQMNLGKSEAEQLWNEKSKEFSCKIQDLNTRMNQVANEAEDKWEDFSDEMSSAWKHFKKAFD